MNEIEKLYENCNIQKTKSGYCSWQATCPYDDIECGDDCPYWKYEDEAKYPPFTAEKQLELIKFLFNHNVYYDIDEKGNYWFHISDEIENSKYREFDEAIAECINKMWQSLAEEEKEKVKGILNENIR